MTSFVKFKMSELKSNGIRSVYGGAGTPTGPCGEVTAESDNMDEYGCTFMYATGDDKCDVSNC